MKLITHKAIYCNSCLPIIDDKRQEFLRDRENRYNQK